MASSSTSYRTDWRTSNAKKILRNLISSGAVTSSTSAAEAYQMDSEFQFYDPKRFPQNLKNLMKTMMPVAGQGEEGGNSTRVAEGSVPNNGGEKTTGQVFLKDWRSSKAKQVLLRLIEDRQVTSATNPDYVYEHMFPGFRDYNRSNFKTNLRNLLTKDAAGNAASEFDKEALAHDRAIQGREPECLNLGYPRWYGTDHQRHLQDLVSKEVHKDVSFEELLKMNKMFEKYPEGVFKRHIRQEENRFRERGYWLVKRKKKLEKKEEIDALLAELNLSSDANPNTDKPEWV